MTKEKNNKDRTTEAGFTLIELLVVLVILVSIAGLVGPRVIGYLGTSKSKTAQVQISSLRAALQLYKLDMGQYPTSSQGLEALIKKPDNAESWNGPYLSKAKIPNDPWNRPYHYKQPGEHGEFDIFSYGADNREGGEKENGDVVSW